MKKILYSFTVLIIIAVSMSGCKNKSNEANVNAPSDSIIEEEEANYYTAIYQYLQNEIGKQYSEGDYCVPFYNIVDVDESNEEDIKIWGDYWVYNYKLVNDTLKTVSGGNHPGLMHVCKNDDGYEVTEFDQVADGSDNIPSAKRIFGDKFESFQTIQSDDQMREQMRAEELVNFVKAKNLSATMYQDYGWPAKVLEL
jgi:hypothetical protein